MTFQAEMVALAIELIDEFGADGTLKSPAPTREAFDKISGRAVAAATPIERPVRVAVGPVEVESDDGRTVRKTVATTLAGVASGDTLATGGTVYVVGKVTTLQAQGLPIVFRAEVQ